MSEPVLFVALFALVALVVAATLMRRSRRRAAHEAAESTAGARQWVERLSGQVERTLPRSEPAQRSIAAASELLERAHGMLRGTRTPTHATRIRETAVEGLHFVRAAHLADGDPPGPPLPPLSGGRTAGTVDQGRRARFGGRELAASPAPSDAVPFYFPGGRVVGRPVPCGWYSERWWADAAGGWPPEAAGLFDALLTGDPGIPYDGADFEAGYGADPRDAAG